MHVLPVTGNPTALFLPQLTIPRFSSSVMDLTRYQSCVYVRYIRTITIIVTIVTIIAIITTTTRVYLQFSDLSSSLFDSSSSTNLSRRTSRFQRLPTALECRRTHSATPADSHLRLECHRGPICAHGNRGDPTHDFPEVVIYPDRIQSLLRPFTFGSCER